MYKNYKLLEIQTKKKITSDFLSAFSSFLKWSWIEFDSIREYEPWDSIKSIDWKTTAKLGDVFIKNYEAEKNLKILFVIENSPSLDFWSEYKNKKDILKQFFFLLSYSSISNWYEIWVFINNCFLDFRKDEKNIIKTLKNLDGKEFISNKDLKKLNLKNTLIFFLSDSLEPNIDEIKYLNIKNEVVYINIFDHFENFLSEDDFEFSSQNIFSFFFKKKKTKYREFRKDRIKFLDMNLKKHNTKYLHIDNRDDLFLKTYKFLSEYKKT